ncbi:MAG: hypothetical protein ACM3VS_08035 [Candidatus Dadabacteria bacterium]
MRLLFLLFFPFLVNSQTVHQDDGKIRYKGTVPFNKTLNGDVSNEIQASFISAIKNAGKLIETSADANRKFTAIGLFHLASTAAVTNLATYLLTVEMEPDKYKFKIDSVSFVQEVRGGGKTTVINSKEFLEKMDETGDTAIATEKVLNEFDMNVQKLLVMANKELQKAIEK